MINPDWEFWLAFVDVVSREIPTKEQEILHVILPACARLNRAADPALLA